MLALYATNFVFLFIFFSQDSCIEIKLCTLESNSLIVKYDKIFSKFGPFPFKDD